MSQEIIDYLNNLKEAGNDEYFNFSFNRFFKEPHSPDQIDQFGDTIKSTLYMLRQDIEHCIEKVNGKIAIWAGTSLILTGIDLLSQYYTGKIQNISSDDSNKKELNMAERYTKYCEDFGISDLHVSHDDKICPLYYFRNSILHGYTLRHNSTGVKQYFFACDYKKVTNQNVITHLNPNEENNTYKYFIDLFYLFEKFNNSINIYKDKLEEGGNLKHNFINAINYYGFIIPPVINSERSENVSRQYGILGLDESSLVGTTTSASSLFIPA